MNSPNIFVRFSTALLAALAGSAFVAAYTSIKVHNANHQNLELPPLAHLFAWASPCGFVVPALMLLTFIACVRSKKQTGLVVDVVSSIGWLYALVWSLSCIVAWELPYVLLGAPR